MYCDYLAEVVAVHAASHVAYVEVVDGGGRRRKFTVTPATDLAPLVQGEETVLDALERVTRPLYRGQRELQRVAEVWMADPMVGDAFEHPNGMKLEVIELTRFGKLRARRFIDHGPGYGYRPIEEVYDSPGVFRAAYEFKNRPGYYLLPLSTWRPDFRKNYPPPGGQNSPLFFREGKSAK